MLWPTRLPWLMETRLPKASTPPSQMATTVSRRARSLAMSTPSSTTMRQVSLQRVQLCVPLEVAADRDLYARARRNTAISLVNRALPARPRLRPARTAPRSSHYEAFTSCCQGSACRIGRGRVGMNRRQTRPRTRADQSQQVAARHRVQSPTEDTITADMGAMAVREQCGAFRAERAEHIGSVESAR